MSEEEIRLIKGYFNEQYCCDLDEIKDIANKMIRENWRLNNIINKAVEYIEELQNISENKNIYVSVYDLVQLLKGSDKE